jgi:gliding motility-associated lipoprotein GldB
MTLTSGNILSAMKYCLLFFAVVLFVSCNDESKVEKEIDKIPIDIKIDRFDQAFAASSPADLPKLKASYPAFFPKRYNDSIWVQKLTDTLQHQLENNVEKQFPTDKKLNDILIPLFQHIKYYFPKFKTPRVVTIVSYVDYQNKVILANNMLVIGLDNYFGSDHEFYKEIDKYVSKNMKESRIGPDVAEVYARQLIRAPQKNSFLAQIIYYGKMLYLEDLWLPKTSDAEKIGYTDEEVKWAKDNEMYMWRYFVEKELLYSTDPKLGARFINPAPFSKFYLEIDNDSPGMLGRYLGWQIVRSYMENNDTNVQQLMIMNADEIYTNSKYKPKK